MIDNQRIPSYLGDKTRPSFILPIALAVPLLFGFGQNFELSLLSAFVLVAGLYLLWRPTETPVLLYIFLYHWLQGSIYLFYSAVSATPLDRISSYTSSLDVTILLTLFGTIFFAIGLRIGAGRSDQLTLTKARSLVLATAQFVWFIVYLGSWAAALIFWNLAALYPNLAQPLLAISDVRWAAYFVFTFSSFANPRASKPLWMLVFGIEIASSLGGFFSSFKLVFIFTFFGMMAAAARITLHRAFAIAALTSLAILFGLVWTAVKPVYRAYVSAGDVTTQSTNVSRADATSKLFELITNVSAADLDVASRQLVARVAEIDIFGAAIDYVPHIKPHANGEIWFDAITRFLTPRFLFPDKAIIDDSALTNTYTGLGVAGREEGTQISMGFYADSYIDFGPVLMMPMLLAFGTFAGWVFRWLAYSRKGGGLIGLALATVTLFRLESVGYSSAKVLPGLVISLITYTFLLSVAPRALAFVNRNFDPGADHF